MAAKEGQHLCSSDLLSTKMSAAQKLTNEVHELLKQDLEKVTREKSDFEEMTKTLNQVHFGSSVKLNVGGVIYKTSVATLQKDPDSMLSAMFSGRHELKRDEEDGAYFIDRDGTHFRHILNYLRSGELIYPSDKMTQKQLLTEAKFYQVQGIITQLEREIFPFKSSVIIKNEDHRLALMSWLPASTNISALLFRASASYGGTVANFHRCCDNKGPTLVVIKSGEYICGGYTSMPWTSPSSLSAMADSHSFLFTLVNPSGSEPIKISGITGTARLLRRKDCGPSFGTLENFDLHIYYENGFRGNLNLGHGFMCPPNAKSDTYFTGETPFVINDLEVFQVDFEFSDLESS